ncbi:MAG TPA: VOC family protein [Gemmataceae bacterium]|jgi:lactoylglutathione lyase|nr:VOC family protein [Gemmataceae bacterium]
MRLSYAIVHVSDMKRSVAFYRDVLGLPLRFESPGWTEFATDGATLALHQSASTPSNTEASIPAGRCRPGLAVPNLESFHQRMLAAGVPCVQAPKETFGTLIAQYADPDGLVIAVSEERRGR